MNRRGFLTSLAGLLGTAVLDPEKLLWRPGEKTIFLPTSIEIPEYPVWPTNQFVTTEQITRAALEVLKNNLQFVSYANKKYFDPDFKIGDTIICKRPQKFVLSS